MTTRIEIKNEGVGTVKVFALDASLKKVSGQEEVILTPGASTKKYVWSDTIIAVQEE
jgi:hypothetical protein